MCDQPPAKKRLKQSSIVDAFRKQNSGESNNGSTGSPVKGPEDQEETKDPDTMFGGDDPVKNFQSYRKAEKAKIAEAAENRAAASPKNYAKDSKSSMPQRVSPRKRDVPDASTPSTSRVSSDPMNDSQSSVASSTANDMGDSPLLFDSDIEALEDIPEPPSSDASKNTNSPFSLGTPISSLNTYPACLPDMGNLSSSQHHTVLIKLPYKVGDKPVPYPSTYMDKWDADHVRLPCSSENLYPVEGNDGGKKLENRWEVIQTALLSGITSSLDLEEAILSYNTRYSQKWDFRGLHSFFTEIVEAEETAAFFKHTMPKMVNLALELPQLCTQPIPMLKRNSTKSITMSQHQAASLLANAFFSTFPRRNSNKRGSEYSSYPDINMSSLFQGGRHPKSHRKAEKLKCIINYFRRVTTEMPQGTITFRRQCIKQFPKWHECQTTLRRLNVSASGTIEDDGLGMLQVDFANKFLGGGVLGYGCVQEEIRFLLCPELILSRLFTEMLEKNECLVMTGSEAFSTYTGYADSFKWNGNFVDSTPRDPWGRRCTEIVAIDALVFRTYVDQFHVNLVRRELNKAYCGFLTPGIGASHLSAIASGNWGCGAFGGDFRLKALIQLMAAAEAQRDLCYFTFQNYDFMEDLHKMHEFITAKELSVADIFNLIQQYYQNVCQRSSRTRRPKTDLYEYIYQVYNPNDGDTDSTDPVPDTEADDDMSQEMQHAQWMNKNSPDYAANTP